jgi:hypothetical protein
MDKESTRALRAVSGAQMQIEFELRGRKLDRLRLLLGGTFAQERLSVARTLIQSSSYARSASRIDSDRRRDKRFKASRLSWASPAVRQTAHKYDDALPNAQSGHRCFRARGTSREGPWRKRLVGVSRCLRCLVTGRRGNIEALYFHASQLVQTLLIS